MLAVRRVLQPKFTHYLHLPLRLLRLLLSLTTLSVWLAACTKPTTSASHVSLNFGGFSTHKGSNEGASGKSNDAFFTPSASNLSRVMLNISGSGIDRAIFVFWDRHENATATPPESFNLEVPRGTGRLVQLLAVFEDTANSNMVFYYGDSIVDMNADIVPVSLSASELTIGAGEASIVGRYLRADGSGPTGLVDMRFQPPGKPAMTVAQTEIFSGWFNFFGLQNAPFTYALEDGTVLFQSVTGQGAGLSSANPVNSMRVYIPPYYNTQTSSSSSASTTRFLNRSRRMIMGFFGPGAGSRKICYKNNSTPEELSYRYVSNTGSDVRKWIGSTVPITDDSTSAQAGVETGGSGVANPSACGAGGDAYSQFLSFDHLSNSYDDALGFRGPFKPVIAGSGTSSPVFLKGEFAAGTINLAWDFLPGATDSGGVDGVGIFVRISAEPNKTEDYRSERGLACNSMLAAGFVFVDRVPVSTKFLSVAPAKFGSSYSATDLQNAWNQNRLQIVACPYSASRSNYYETAIDLRNSGSGGTLLRIAQVAPYAGGNGGEYNTCAEFKVKMTDSAGNPVNVIAATTVNLGHYGSSRSHFYSNGNCDGNGLSSHVVSIAAGQSESASFYYKPMSGPGSYSLRALAPNSLEGRLDYGAYMGTSPTSFEITGPNELVIGRCYPYEIRLKQGSQPSAYATDQTINLALNGGLAGGFFTTPNCVSGAGSATSSFTMPAHSHMGTIHFKPTTVGASGSITASHTDQNGTTGTIHTGETTLAKYLVASNTGARYEPGLCQEVFIRPANQYGAAIELDVGKTVTVTASGAGVGLYSNSSNCASSTSAVTALTLVFPARTVESNRFYFKSTAASVAFSAGDGTIVTGSQLFTALPPENVMLVKPSGAPIDDVVIGACYPAKIKATNGNAAPYIGPAFLMNIGLSGATGQFYADATCSGNAVVQAVIPAGMSETAVYFKVTGGTGLNFWLEDASDLTRDWFPSGGILRSLAIVRSPSGMISSNQCVAIMPSISWNPITDLTFEVALLSTSNLATNSLGGYFFADSTCTTALGSGTTKSLTATTAMWTDGGAGKFMSPAPVYIKFGSGPFLSQVPTVKVMATSSAAVPGLPFVTSEPSYCSTPGCNW